MNNSLKNVTAVIVLYNVSKIIFNCLDNLKNINIIIADNGDNDLLITKRIKDYKNVIKYYKFKKNIGFGRACNYCFNRSKTKYTLLIEPDVIISEINIINLINGFDKYPNAGILVPTLIDEKKNVIDYLDNLPELKQLEKNKDTNHIFHGDTSIFFCWAAILLLNNDIIKKTGLFNKNIFIFWEDFYLCRKLKKLSVSIIKIFSSRALHYEGASTKKTIKSQLIINKHHILSSYIYFGVDKENILLKKKLFIYLFRFISYLFIFNINKSLKNFARLCAVISYIKKK
jgi:N-acetylglucosaminyl-diphospho-decaprenol L-rhamnosyltransferase